MRFIGGKNLLLHEIERVIWENVPEAQSFCDIFAGSGAVARHFKRHYQILANDIMHFSYVLLRAAVAINKKPEFAGFAKDYGQSPFSCFSALADQAIEFKAPPFIQNHYSPAGSSPRQYFTSTNALKIDHIRQTLESLRSCGTLNEDEYYYLLASLIEAVPSVANIAGTFGAYLKHWDKRAFKPLELVELPVHDNGQVNLCFNQNANDLIRSISGDILYLDPPYNKRQYGPNYHVLETISRYDYPEIHGKTGLRPYHDTVSRYCQTKEVTDAFADLVSHADFRHIIVSYSSEGIMTEEQIGRILCEYGKPDTLKVYRVPYRRYKHVARPVKHNLEELIFYIREG